MNLSDLSASQLRQAAELKEQLQMLQEELTTLLGSPILPQAASAAPSKKKRISAAGLANIRAAQRARWAKVKAAVRPVQPPKRKRSIMSAAAKAAISRSARARWAKIKAARRK